LGEVREALDHGAALGGLGEGERLDRLLVELVVVVEHGGAVEEQAQVGFEAVGAGAQRLLERGDRVFGEAPRTAAMAEDQEVLNRRNRLSHLDYTW
jgi:hypothetical protein